MFISIISRLNFDLLSSIIFYGEGEMIVVLAIPRDLDDQGNPERPQLMVFEKSENVYELISTDLLSIRLTEWREINYWYFL